MLRPFVVLGLLLCAAPAAADVTGRYRNGEEMLTIEANGEGFIRMSPDGREDYTLLNGEDAYIVSTEQGRPVVIRWSDMIAALDAQMDALLGSNPERDAAPAERGSQWQAAGPATVEGRPGIEYRLPSEPMPEGHKIILSDDARLAPLGLAWSRALVRIPSIGRLFGSSASPAVQELGAMLATRAPLQLGPIRLVEVRFEAIAASRFALPAAPLSRDQVAERVRPRLVTPPSESAH